MEVAALWVIGAHMIFLPWALGTMHPWAQWVSLGFSGLSLILALVPREYEEEHTGGGRFRLVMWPKLLKFPIFHLGLAVLAIVTVQGLNPAWDYRTNGAVFWLEPRENIEWLPGGVNASFGRWGPWRMVVIYASAWLTACAIWVAFTRRRTLQYFLVTIAINGLLLAAFGVGQRLFGNEKIFWLYTPSNPAFFASFIYKNHAGAYLNLALATTCGLAAFYYLRGLRRMEKSNPSGVLAFFATCIAVSIVTSYARGATLVMLAYLACCIITFVIHQVRTTSVNRKPVIALGLLLLFGYFLKTGLEAVRSREAWDRMRQGIMREDVSLASRERVTAASLEMLQDKWITGVGAGAFRFVFPIYQHRHPDLVTFPGGGGMFWEHAHNDIVQFPIELGVFGAAAIALAFAYWLFALLRSYFWENPLSSCVVFGLALTVIYAWWDFPFQCPAILVTWCALWPAALMWARFEDSGARS